MRSPLGRSMLVASVAVMTLALAGCGGSSEGGSSLADGLAKRGVGAFAAGRWRCAIADVLRNETEAPGGRIVAIIAVDRDGRFSFDQVGSDGTSTGDPMSGTWSVDGLQLRLTVPWDDDGNNGFYRYLLDADQDPPTRLKGGSTDERGSVLDFKVSVGQDRVTLAQTDAEAPLPDRSKPNYGVAVDCRRQSHDPGTIPPTVPPSVREN